MRHVTFGGLSTSALSNEGNSQIPGAILHHGRVLLVLLSTIRNPTLHNSTISIPWPLHAPSLSQLCAYA